MSLFNDSTILVSGATGSLGRQIVRKILQEKYDFRSLRCMGHSEYTTYSVANEIKREYNDERVRFFMGNIEDESRVNFALNDVDFFIHCAAKKNLDYTEYDCEDTIKTNVIGTLNLVKVAIKNHRLKKFLYINSDKAILNISTYGASKALGEHTVLWANTITKNKAFSSIRFGNIQDSRGNVVPLWKQQAIDRKPLTLTHPDASRFYITQEKAVEMILLALEKMKGGEIFVPSEEVMPEVKMMDLAKTISPNIVITGLRKNEKVREKLFSDEEAPFLEPLPGTPMRVIRPYSERPLKPLNMPSAQIG